MKRQTGRIWIDFNEYKNKYRCRIRLDEGYYNVGLFDTANECYAAALKLKKGVFKWL